MGSSHAVGIRQATAIGVLGAAISFAWSWRPSYWYDEAASLSAASRSPGQLWQLLGSRDAVHGAYYFALHGWVSLFGTSEVATRSLSILGLGITCAGVSVLGQQLGGRALGLAGGLVSAVLPGLSWAGAEAREFSWSAAFAVLASIVLVQALASGRARVWALYAAVMAAAGYVFFFCLLLLPAHLLTLLLLRRNLRPWLAAAGASVAMASPMIYVAWTQRGQVEWINMAPGEMLGKGVLLRQFFLSTRADDELGLALVAAVVLSITSVLLVAAALRAWRTSESTKTGLAFALPWAVLPTILIVGYSLAKNSIYQERYLTFTAPGLALAMGAGLTRIRRRPAFLTVCTVLGLLVLPILVQQKGTASRSGEDYRALARFVSSQSADAVIFGQDKGRAVRVAYPADFKQVREPTLVSTPVQSASLWGQVGPLGRLAPDSFQDMRVVLFLNADSSAAHNPNYRWLVAHGCHEVGSVRRTTLTVYSFDC